MSTSDFAEHMAKQIESQIRVAQHHRELYVAAVAHMVRLCVNFGFLRPEELMPYVFTKITKDSTRMIIEDAHKEGLNEDFRVDTIEEKISDLMEQDLIVDDDLEELSRHMEPLHKALSDMYLPDNLPRSSDAPPPPPPPDNRGYL